MTICCYGRNLALLTDSLAPPGQGEGWTRRFEIEQLLAVVPVLLLCKHEFSIIG